ncbi:MAG: hypothetical protein R3B49_08565 [Phycisphaerales bacterium]
MAEQPGFLDRHHFLLRRLHSLSGIVPIGVFLIAHLVTNSSLAWGKLGLRGEDAGLSFAQGGVRYFQEEVTWINTQVPHLFLIEVTLWASIAFHAILGVIYARSGRPNTPHYPYMDNWRYVVQRWSGYFGVLFIFYHVATLRWGWSWLVPGGAQWSHHFATSTLAAALQGAPDGWTIWGLVVSVFYFLGISLLVFHFANGLWTAAISWGLTVSAAAQKRWGVVCTLVGLALMAAAWSALGAAVLTKPADALEIEQRAIIDNHGEGRLLELLHEREQGEAIKIEDTSLGG